MSAGLLAYALSWEPRNMVNLDAQRQKIESLNSADHRIIDTITGALLRVFCQLEEQDRALQLHRERLRRLETASPRCVDGDGPKVAPTTTRQHRGQHQWGKAGHRQRRYAERRGRGLSCGRPGPFSPSPRQKRQDSPPIADIVPFRRRRKTWIY